MADDDRANPARVVPRLRSVGGVRSQCATICPEGSLNRTATDALFIRPLIRKDRRASLRRVAPRRVIVRGRGRHDWSVTTWTSVAVAESSPTTQPLTKL